MSFDEAKKNSIFFSTEAACVIFYNVKDLFLSCWFVVRFFFIQEIQIKSS